MFFDDSLFGKMEGLAEIFRMDHEITGRVNVDTLKHVIKKMGGEIKEVPDAKTFKRLGILPLTYDDNKFLVNLNVSCVRCVPPLGRHDNFRWMINYRLAYLLGVLINTDSSLMVKNKVIGEFFNGQDMNNFLFIDCGRLFAESLLMPKDLIGGMMGELLHSRIGFNNMRDNRKIIELAKHFETPVSAVCTRLCNLELISCL